MTGVYVPEFYRPEYGTDGTIKGVYKLNESAPDIVQRYILPETEKCSVSGKTCNTDGRSRT